ncbi:hypothetical protein, partial [Myroides albus]|uniref:hypothetical protein n=1 Tax=Myroides albus TaxID=2562892 RepID=UPI003742A8D8
KTEIDWSSLNTVNKTFELKDVEGVASLVIIDSDGNSVHMAVADIAKNETFLTELTENQDFVDKIFNNNEFITKIKNVQAYSSLTDQSATENTSEVKL